MTYDEMRETINEAERTMKQADYFAGSMAQMLVGRLRRVKSTYYGDALSKLKRELSDYNMTKRAWK